MQRSTSVGLGALFLVGLGAVLLLAGPRRTPPEPEPAPGPAELPERDGAAGLEAPEAGIAEPVRDLDMPESALTLADGGPVPALPKGAPRSVRFGVILITYRGAEDAAKDARSRGDALAKARSLIAEATENFAETVKKGDPGSTADAGRLPRGVLEPRLEHALFTLDKGAVHGAPIDTPRGFWIVRRID